MFVIPVAAELDLKAAARSVGEKSVAMIHVADINKVTGYVRGGCSPVGMKKQYKTVFDESVLAQEKCMFPAGASAPRCAVLRRISSVPPAPPRQRSSSEPGRKVRLLGQRRLEDFTENILKP